MRLIDIFETPNQRLPLFIFNEGGWEDPITQKTVITPGVVSAALAIANKFSKDFNSYLQKSGTEISIQVGHPLGSTAWYKSDSNDKTYGDIDLQMLVVSPPEDGLTATQISSRINKLLDQFIRDVNL